MSPTSAMEDYLEAILILKERAGEVRVRDLAAYLNIKPPSVNEMIYNMMAKSLILHEPRGDIQLTQKGLKIARQISNRHTLLMRFFTDVLGIDERIAERDACAVEHSLSKITVEHLERFMDSPQNTVVRTSGA